MLAQAPRLAAVTALYNLDRENHDGRPFIKYLEWLNATLRLPVPFTVFLDPSIDRRAVTLKGEDTLVQMPLEEFVPFAWREQVEAICRMKKKHDIAFRLPAHPLLMYSKFDMLRRAAEGSEASGLIWVD